MKKQRRQSNGYLEIFLFAMTLMALSACQRPAQDTSQRNFQSKANKILGAMAQDIYYARRGYIRTSKKRAAHSPNVRGFVGNECFPGQPCAASDFGRFDSFNRPFGAYGGGPRRNATDCLGKIGAIERSARNFVPHMAAVTQCLESLLAQGNPAILHAFNHLDTTGQGYLQYIMNWRQIAPPQNSGGFMSGFDPLMMGMLFGSQAPSFGAGGGFSPAFGPSPAPPFPGGGSGFNPGFSDGGFGGGGFQPQQTTPGGGFSPAF